MNLKTIYLLLCVIGTVLPLWEFSPWLVENGLNIPLFVEQMFPNRVAGAFSIDVLVSTVVLWVFVLTEGLRSRVPHLWALDDGLVVTVAGDLSRAELVAVAGSLRTSG